MNVYVNPNYLFKGIEQSKIKTYTKALEELIYALNDVKGSIPPEIINQFKIKKMKGTKDIFKFYLTNDGSRCLFKYGKEESLVFNNHSSLYILQVVDHDDQGIAGKKFERKLLPLKDFLLYDIVDDKLDAKKLRDDLNDSLDKQIMKTVPLGSIKTEDLYKKMYDIDNRSMYRLSINQQLALIEDGPLFIRGSAGSGKTLVAISMALKNAHEKTSQAYFTFTPLLRDNASDLYLKYSKMAGIVGDVEFNVMNDYFLKELNIKRFQYFSFEKFKTWMKDNDYTNRYKWMNNLDTVQIWTEIRGLIKGYIGKDYYRILTLDNLNKTLSKDEIRTLDSSGVISKAKDSNTTYHIINSEELYNRYVGSQFHEYLINNDVERPLIDKYSYMTELAEGYSPFDKDTREKLLDFVYNIYQPHLDKHRYYDDNDLARMLIKKINNNEIEKFDYIIIDEVQDLTEMQIIALTKLSNNYNNILMAGDNSQVINPTFFKRGRTGLIFRNIHNVSLNTSVTLNENYRNSEEIVEVIQKLLEIRQSKLGTYSEDIKEVSVDLDKEAGLPIFIDVKEDIMVSQIGPWINVPKVAVIVSNEEVKKSLYKKFEISDEVNIYTVHEIKGQEFSKIIIYNIISDYQSYWDDIMNDKISKGSDLVNEYKYYFNLLYVAITRGRENIFMYEKHKDSKIIKQIIDYFDIIDQNTIGALDVSDYDTKQNQLEEAKRLFMEKEFLRAKTMYIRLNESSLIKLSEAYHYIYNNEDNEKGLVMLLDYENKYLEEVYPLIDPEKHLLLYIIYGYILKKRSIKNIDILLKDKSIIDMAQKYEKKYVDSYYIILRYSLKIMTDINTYQINNILRSDINE